jgi:hypothetical protein
MGVCGLGKDRGVDEHALEIKYLVHVGRTWMMSAVEIDFANIGGGNGYIRGVGEGRWTDDRGKYGR